VSSDETFELEFNRVARWTADVIAAGAPEDAIPGACNGSGRPSALAWLADALGIGPSTRLVDTGAGLGGPAAWLRRHYAGLPVVAEPMRDAARGAHRLFDLPAVVAWSHQLPLAATSFDAALALAVLSTAGDKPAYLREVHRILRPGGGLGLLEYVTTTGPHDVPADDDVPANNEFLAPAELDGLLDEAGFRVVDTVYEDDLAPSPPEWAQAEQRVDRLLHEAHAGDPGLAEAAEEQARFGRLLADGTLRVRLVHAVAR
jgi:SAM-dependent methyltransferase